MMIAILFVVTLADNPAVFVNYFTNQRIGAYISAAFSGQPQCFGHIIFIVVHNLINYSIIYPDVKKIIVEMSVDVISEKHLKLS
jgi:hypothetical protein